MNGQPILVYQTGVHPPLKAELQSKNVEFIEMEGDLTRYADIRAQACWASFYDCMNHTWSTWHLRRHLRRMNIPLVAWNRDAPHYLNRKKWRIDMFNKLRLIDIYATHTLIDTTRQFADTICYLANAADIESYRLAGPADEVLSRLRDSSRYEWDVSFFGGMDGVRYKEDRARAEFFAALGDKLTQRGVRFRFQEAQGMSVAEQIRFIQASRINLNFGARCEYQAPIASGLPERCFGIPAAGGFLLCDKRTHAKDHFDIGVDWAEFDGIEDCVKKIEFWLANFSAARDLAERCHWHVVQRETYRQRAQTLLDAIAAWHRGERGLIAC